MMPGTIPYVSPISQKTLRVDGSYDWYTASDPEELQQDMDELILIALFEGLTSEEVFHHPHYEALQNLYKKHYPELHSKVSQYKNEVYLPEPLQARYYLMSEE
jgi:hypothetical protein